MRAAKTHRHVAAGGNSRLSEEELGCRRFVCAVDLCRQRGVYEQSEFSGFHHDSQVLRPTRLVTELLRR
jgi:hypothetical protein